MVELEVDEIDTGEVEVEVVEVNDVEVDPGAPGDTVMAGVEAGVIARVPRDGVGRHVVT